MIGWREQAIRNMIKDEKFPMLKYGKPHKVEFSAFMEFCKKDLEK